MSLLGLTKEFTCANYSQEVREGAVTICFKVGKPHLSNELFVTQKDGIIIEKFK